MGNALILSVVLLAVSLHVSFANTAQRTANVHATCVLPSVVTVSVLLMMLILMHLLVQDFFSTKDCRKISTGKDHYKLLYSSLRYYSEICACVYIPCHFWEVRELLLFHQGSKLDKQFWCLCYANVKPFSVWGFNVLTSKNNLYKVNSPVALL